MATGLRIVAINPNPRVQLNPTTISAAIGREMARLGADLVGRMAKYPPQQPTDYRRTGNLGRNWRMRVYGLGRIDVYNSATSTGAVRTKRGRRRRSRGVASAARRRPYAVYVQGPKTGNAPGTRQAAVMAGKGWSNITDEANTAWDKALPGLQRALVVRPT